MRKVYVVSAGLVIIALISLGAYLLLQTNDSSTYVHFDEQNVSIEVDVADEPTEQQRGLSGRDSLESGRGMWFAFPEPAYRSFWMKDMQFAIDIIWLNGEKKITAIESEVAPPAPQTTEQELQRYTSPPDTQYVLEVPAGFSEEVGLDVGHKAEVRQ